MLKEAQQRMSIFQRRMREQGASLALLTDESSIVDLAGFWGYLGLVGAQHRSRRSSAGCRSLRAAGRQKARAGTP